MKSVHHISDISLLNMGGNSYLPLKQGDNHTDDVEEKNYDGTVRVKLFFSLSVK
jgi:hypothetical protein